MPPSPAFLCVSNIIPDMIFNTFIVPPMNRNFMDIIMTKPIITYGEFDSHVAAATTIGINLINNTQSVN